MLPDRWDLWGLRLWETVSGLVAGSGVRGEDHRRAAVYLPASEDGPALAARDVWAIYFHPGLGGGGCQGEVDLWGHSPRDAAAEH